jgi:polyferredoxin
MKLTKLELTRLRNFQRARERPPKAVAGLWRVKWLLLAIIALILIAYWLSPWPSAARFILGFGVGALWCVCVIAFILPRLWPLTREILNWERIDQLIKEHDSKSA